MRRSIIVALILVAVLAIAGCSQNAAAGQKEKCFANEALLRTEMQLLKADSGMDAPFQIVLAKTQLVCPSGGKYSYDATSGVVTCSVHGHP